MGLENLKCFVLLYASEGFKFRKYHHDLGNFIVGNIFVNLIEISDFYDSGEFLLKLINLKFPGVAMI